MTVTIIAKNEIIKKFSETVGVEKATALVNEAASALNMLQQESFNKEEALRLFDKLKEKGGMIKIIAGFLASEAHLMDL